MTVQHWQIGNKMSADLDMSIGRAAMAFTGATPWHRDGTRLDDAQPLEVWAEAAGMKWQALSAPVQFKTAAGTLGTYGDKRVIYRSDTGAPLSVMGDGYKIVQPLECLEFFRDLIRAQGFKMHTAGVLAGGRKFWALAETPNGGEVVKGDKVRQFLTVCTSLDGTSATTVDFTNVRIVCANTFAEHRSEKRSAGAVKVFHSAEFDAEAAKRSLGLSAEKWQAFMKAAQTMAEQRCTLEEARHILREIFGQPVSAKPDAASLAMSAINRAKGGAGAMVDQREQRSVARCLDLFTGAGRGASHAGVKGTRWGLFNAITEHVDHEQGRDATRLQAAWFGRGAGFKDEAYKLLTA
jgi:phage/plasmid-like protein (TIGR03299 family)